MTASETDTPRPRRAFAVAATWIVLAALGLVVAFGWVSAHSDRSQAERRRAWVDGAVAGALALIDVHAATIDQDLAALRSLSTGGFADELTSAESSFVASIRNSAVDSDGRVDAAALATESGTSAVVLIAASARVGNSGGEATPRTYRLRIGVDDVDGRILVSSVEFVP